MARAEAKELHKELRVRITDDFARVRERLNWLKVAVIGGLPAATGRKMHFSGTTVLMVINGKIVEEIGLDDGVTALTQLGLIKAA